MATHHNPFGSKLLFSGLLVLLAGCSRLVPAEGVVTMDGKPLVHAMITFTPEDKKTHEEVSGPVRDGGFQMYTRDQPGILPGKYKATVSILEKNGVCVIRELAPPHYVDPEKTPLTVEISSGGMTDIKLELSAALERHTMK